MVQEPPKIVQIDKEVRQTNTGIAYVQDYAVMNDGSRWEVPCIGNSGLWRKVNLSISELQTNFNEYYLALHATPSNNESNGKANEDTKGQAQHKLPRRRK